VVFEAVVGAFEVVVLQGGTAQEVIDFLDDNNYAQDPDAAPIMQQYLDDGFLFAAVKLAAGAEVDDIHPLSFKFQGTEPCVPIRLTRIAAKDDMGIRAYFLGQARWAPSNYSHVVLNPLHYNWSFSAPASYTNLLSMAVDEADGQAFVTEYAGSSNKVETFNIYRATWDETAFIGVDPVAAIGIIADQNLNIHPLIQALLLEFIPPPDGLDPQDFWNNIDFYANQIDMMAWDDAAFAAALLERIIEPGLHAIDLLDTWPKLTRLNTTISPSEMTLDPTFHANADLPDVTNTLITTTEQVLCGGDSVFHVDVDGVDTPVCVPEAETYPDWDGMPYSLRIEQVPQMGPVQVATDNADVIAAAYDTYQGSVECLADGGGAETGTGDGDGDGGGDGGDPGAEAGGSETGGSYNLPYDVSCGCSTDDGRAPIGVALGLLVLGLIGPWRRRRNDG
jgi:MYXO-CTERM domain-containing protein